MHSENVKTKDHGVCRDLCRKVKTYNLSSFCQSFDTLGAEDFLNLFTILIKRNLLQVWFEGSFGRLHGEGAIITKSRFLIAVSAYSHL